MLTTTTTTARSARLGLRATPAQETVLRRAAEVAHKSLTDFILDAAYQAAEQTLLDQRLFMVSGSQYQAILEMLTGRNLTTPVADLFSRPPVWARNESVSTAAPMRNIGWKSSTAETALPTGCCATHAKLKVAAQREPSSSVMGPALPGTSA